MQPTDSKPKLLAHLTDAVDLREVTAVGSQWYQVVRAPDRNRIIELIHSDCSIAGVVVEGWQAVGDAIHLLQHVASAKSSVRRILLAHVPELSLIHALHTGTIQRLVHRPCSPHELATALLPVSALAIGGAQGLLLSA